MKLSVLAAAAAVLSFSACVENAAAPETPAPVRLRATVTESNSCDVSVMSKAYSSKGQIRGDVPSQFVGTVAGQSYHGFGCWVSTSGGDGDLVVLFSGNNLGKPLAVGTYTLSREILDNTPLGKASVAFRPSDLGGDKLRTLDDASGTVVVEITPGGGRKIVIDVDVERWGRAF
ncbi:MAG: hypothetical protein ABIS03_07605 [Gemmatimonadaceae bacterium]